jgi:hypothetical protein
VRAGSTKEDDMLTTLCDNATGNGGRLGARGRFATSRAGGEPTGMNDHDRPTGPTMR